MSAITNDSPPPAVAPPAVRALQRVDGLIGTVEQTLLVGFLAILILTAGGQAITNNFFNFTYEWSNEVIRYAVFFTAMAGAALAAQSNKLINMDVVTRRLSPRTRAYVRIAGGLFTVAICIMLVRGGLDLRASMADEGDYEVIRPALGVLALPIGAALMAFHIVLHIAVDALYLSRGTVPPENTGPSLH